MRELGLWEKWAANAGASARREAASSALSVFTTIRPSCEGKRNAPDAPPAAGEED